jgi:hypothetical protein
MRQSVIDGISPAGIFRAGPTGGTVQIVFTGWAPNSTPPANCVSP